MKDRVRISITVRPEIVSLLDSRVDGTKIRNRSHAVEHYLKKALVSPVGQAVILVGNEENTLTDICGETLIEKILFRLKKASIKRIIISSNTDCSKLKKLFTKKHFAEFEFIYAKNKTPGTAAALYSCKQHIAPETFLLIHGDVLGEIDIFDFEDFHKHQNGIATMAITSVADPLPWGIVRIKRNKVIDLIEKPEKTESQELRLTNLINAGIYAFQPEIFKYINSKTQNLEKEVLPVLIKEQQIYSYLLDGVWFNIKDQKMLTKAKNYCTPKHLRNG